MAYTPPVSIPSLGGRNYARDLYGMISGVGEAYYGAKRDTIADQQWQQEQERLNTAQALAQSNADRDYALRLRQFEADQAETAAGPKFYGSAQWYQRNDGSMGFGVLGTDGSFKDVAPPDGSQWAPRVTYQDLGNERVPTFNQGGSIAGPGLDVSGSVPAGYGNTGDGIAPYSGSPQAAERTQAQTQARARLNAVEQDAALMSDQIAAARADASESGSTGFGGRIERLAPWETSASRLMTRLDTIRANVSFDKLQQMREMSPTGGALGAVSDFENRLLQAVRGPVDPNNPTTMMETLNTIEARYAEAVVAHRIAYMTDYEGLPRQVANEAIDAIRAGANPDAVMQRVQQMTGGAR